MKECSTSYGGAKMCHGGKRHSRSSLKERSAFCAPRLDCVLSQDWIAFCLKIELRFVSRLDCVLSQDLIAFCLKTSCVLSTFEDLHCTRPPKPLIGLTLHHRQQRISTVLSSKRHGSEHLMSMMKGTLVRWEHLGKYNAGHLGQQTSYFKVAKKISTLLFITYTDAKDIWECQERQVKGYKCNGIGHIERNCNHAPSDPRNSRNTSNKDVTDASSGE
ncbi:hypothetical protein Tco_1104938 [Tanacetum coccineum]